MPRIATFFYSLASIVIIGYFLSTARSLVEPLLAAFIISVALIPLVNYMHALKLPRLICTLLAVMLFILFIFGLIGFFTRQISSVDFELTTWKIKFQGFSERIQILIEYFWGITIDQQVAMLQESAKAFLKNSATVLNTTLAFTANFFSSFVLFIIALFFFLYYQNFLTAFLYKAFKPQQHTQLSRVLARIRFVVQHYIFGLSLIILIVATLNTFGLIALGIENPILFGSLAAVLTIIPYIGITIGALIPIIFTLSTKESLWYAVGVLILFMVVQFLEGNVLTPNIVGRQVSVNPLAAILGLIIGGMLLGFIGIVFALPVLAIIKVICDETETLASLGYLLGTPEDRKLT